MSVHVRLRVGREAYAIPVENVLEVVALGQLASVPGAGRNVLGVFNLRGEVLPVYDLAALFGVDRDTAAPRLLVTEAGGRKAGLAIDEVTHVEPLPDERAESDSPLLEGSVLADGDLVGIVDMGRLYQALEREATT